MGDTVRLVAHLEGEEVHVRAIHPRTGLSARAHHTDVLRARGAALYRLERLLALEQQPRRVPINVGEFADHQLLPDHGVDGDMATIAGRPVVWLAGWRYVDPHPVDATPDLVPAPRATQRGDRVTVIATSGTRWAGTVTAVSPDGEVTAELDPLLPPDPAVLDLIGDSRG